MREREEGREAEAEYDEADDGERAGALFKPLAAGEQVDNQHRHCDGGYYKGDAERAREHDKRLHFSFSLQRSDYLLSLFSPFCPPFERKNSSK